MKGRTVKNKAFETMFRQCFNNYFRPLTVYAMQFVSRRELAEDIVQDLFLNLYENKSYIQFRKLTANYLYKSVRNSCINFLNYQKVRDINNPHIQDSLSSNPPDPLQTIEFIEFENKFVLAMESLSPRRRKIFEMRKLEGKKNKEIAEELNISVKTVETQICRTLKILHKKLSKYILNILILFFIEIIYFFMQVN
jgi:RNA polymerase sigma-70 factor (ECF subfamily)